MKIKQYSIYWTDLSLTQGAEMNKTRPCVVISPDEMNQYLKTIIIAPVTNTSRQGYPTRTYTQSSSISGWIVLDQIIAIDKNRLKEKIGDLTLKESKAVKDIIKEMLVD